MNASLDTNVIIHLLEANQEEILFNRFDELYVHEFIRNIELQKHASEDILKRFDGYVKNKKFKIISSENIKELGVKRIFEEHIKENKLLYDPQDFGEAYAIALAETLGLVSVVSDDIKKGGPHYYLLHTTNGSIIPLAFYELLLLDFLEEKINEDEFINKFNIINDTFKAPMNIKRKIREFIDRFNQPLSYDRDKRFIDHLLKHTKTSFTYRIRLLIKKI